MAILSFLISDNAIAIDGKDEEGAPVTSGIAPRPAPQHSADDHTPAVSGAAAAVTGQTEVHSSSFLALTELREPSVIGPGFLGNCGPIANTHGLFAITDDLLDK